MYGRRRTDWSALSIGPALRTPQRQAQREAGGLDPVSRSLAERMHDSHVSDIDPRRAPSLRPEPGSALARALR